MPGKVAGESGMPRVGVVLSSGGVRGVYAHTGFLQALHELDIPIAASAAMPVLYEPVIIDGEFYCDGALIDFAPTDAICCRHQLGVVIVHHVSQHSSAHRNLGTALGDSWAMLEVINRSVFREQPWYLSGEPLSLHHCPCGCGAIVIVIEPDLPVMRWPVTSGSDSVRKSALVQSGSLLRPHVDAILDNPRTHLLPFISATYPLPGGCGMNESH